MLSIPLPSLPLNIEWLKLRSALITIPVPQPMTSNPQPNPYRIFRSSTFSLIRPKSRYVSIQENRAFRKASLMMLTLQKPRNTPLFSLYLSFLDRRHTVSTCPVFGNISTQHPFLTSYPLSCNITRSLARLVGLQEIYTIDSTP